MSMYVITHKKFNYPIPDGYIPLLVGANRNENPGNYMTDNTGKNISDKNLNYSELTGLYWLWKNNHDENIGISHYRRYFSKSTTNNMFFYRTFMLGDPQPISIKKLDD